jgi:hypothetical protein
LEPLIAEARFFPSSPSRHLIIVASPAYPFTREGSGTDQFIARANIAHLRDKLAAEQDETRRQTLLSLLAEHEAKLAVLENDPPKKKKRN